jgi:hypothetical protein
MDLAAMDSVDQRPAKLRAAGRQFVERLLNLVCRQRVVLAQGEKPVVDRLQEQDLPAHVLIITIPYADVTGWIRRRQNRQVPGDRPPPLVVTLRHGTITALAADISVRTTSPAGGSHLFSQINRHICGLSHSPLCRYHHRAKQAEGWRLEQPEPGVLRWRTPAGRKYTTAPTVYPV